MHNEIRTRESRVSLEQENSENDLGVIFDDKLLFREHISHTSKTANIDLGLIFKSFTYLDKDAFLAFTNLWFDYT